VLGEIPDLGFVFHHTAVIFPYQATRTILNTTSSFLIRTVQTNLKTDRTKTTTRNNCHVRMNADEQRR